MCEHEEPPAVAAEQDQDRGHVPAQAERRRGPDGKPLLARLLRLLDKGDARRRGRS